MDNGILTSLVSFDQSNIPKPSCVDGWKPVCIPRPLAILQLAYTLATANKPSNCANPVSCRIALAVCRVSFQLRRGGTLTTAYSCWPAIRRLACAINLSPLLRRLIGNCCKVTIQLAKPPSSERIISRQKS